MVGMWTAPWAQAAKEIARQEEELEMDTDGKGRPNGKTDYATACATIRTLQDRVKDLEAKINDLYDAMKD